MKTISPKELATWKKENKECQIIDVREAYEVETCTLGGTHIPMEEVTARISEIRKDVPVVFHCKSGKRSAAIVHSLEQKFGFTNLYTLEGGILAWIDAVDGSLVRY